MPLTSRSSTLMVHESGDDNRRETNGALHPGPIRYLGVDAASTEANSSGYAIGQPNGSGNKSVELFPIHRNVLGPVLEEENRGHGGEEEVQRNTNPNIHVIPPSIEMKASHRRSNRSQRELSPEEYGRFIYTHSLRPMDLSVFPGDNYRDLAIWLQAPPRRSEKLHADDAPDDHCLAVLYDLGAMGDSERRRYFKADDLESLREVPKPGKDCGQVLMLRGCPSSDWIKTIGGKYRLDPEFIRRHLDFFATMTSRAAFSLPSVTSSYSNIVRLTVSTIVSLYPPLSRLGGLDIQRLRRDRDATMAKYLRRYQNIACCGDSIVRDHCILDAHHSILDQSISICVQGYGDGGWSGMQFSLSGFRVLC